MKVLLLNAGSSSLKAAVMESSDGAVVASGIGDWAGDQTRYAFKSADGSERTESVSWKGHAAAVERFVSDLTEADRRDLAGVAHRVVHGGRFNKPVRIDSEVRQRIMELAELAPLHNPPSLETLTAAEAALPSLPHVAVFDTAFHSTLPLEANTYAIPIKWTQEWGIRRYGFHGLSHAYCSQQAARMLRRPLETLKLVICHLGHGCSAAAVDGGQCVDTTMGFTPLEGLMMATRSGSIDPGVIFRLQVRHGLDVAEIENTLNRKSGLLGVSGVSADMRDIVAKANAGHEQASLALKIYTRRVRQAVGALAATMGGVDALVFTAGVGEHASQVRQEVCKGLECLGLQLDEAINAASRPDADVATAESKARILVIATREDVTMLQEACRILEPVSP